MPDLPPDPASDLPVTPPEDGTSRGPSQLGGSGQIAIAMIVMNVGNYGFSMAAARLIGPVEYGAFFTLLNVLMIVSVVSLGLQATAARRISADPTHVAQIERHVLRVSWRAALAVGGLLVALSPALDRLLDIDSMPVMLLTALAAVPMTMMGAQAGILQGERRWRELAIFYVLAGAPRLVIGLALVAWWPGALAAMAGAGVSYLAPYLYGTFVLRRDRAEGASHERHAFSAIIKESVVNSQALFAYFALTNVDMLVGRAVLSSHDSGLYAAGLIVARAVLFLPQFVVIVAFPAMSSSTDRARALTRSLALVGSLGLVCTLATALLPDLALVFAGGNQYDEVRQELWLFAALGTVMSMIQIIVYSVLARQGTFSVLLVWLGLGALVAAAWTTSTVEGLLAVVLLTEGLLLGVLLVVSVMIIRREGAGSDVGTIPVQ